MSIKDKNINIARLIISIVATGLFIYYIVHTLFAYPLYYENVVYILKSLIGIIPFALSVVFSMLIIINNKRRRSYPIVIILSYILTQVIDLISKVSSFSLYNIRIFNNYIENTYNLNMFYILLLFSVTTLCLLICKKWLLIFESVVLSLVSIYSMVIPLVEGYIFFSGYVVALASLLLSLSVGLYANMMTNENSLFSKISDKYLN